MEDTPFLKVLASFPKSSSSAPRIPASLSQALHIYRRIHRAYALFIRLLGLYIVSIVPIGQCIKPIGLYITLFGLYTASIVHIGLYMMPIGLCFVPIGLYMMPIGLCSVPIGLYIMPIEYRYRVYRTVHDAYRTVHRAYRIQTSCHRPVFRTVHKVCRSFQHAYRCT